MPPTRNVRIRHHVSPFKLARARELRRRMTPAERVLWRALRTNRLHGIHFRRQQVIEGFIVDFYCHAAGLVIEVDGPIHSRQREYDSAREAVLRARGLAVIRFKNSEVQRDLPRVLPRITQVYLARTGLLEVPPSRQAGRGPGG